MQKPNTKCKTNNKIWFKFWEKITSNKKYITITVVILVVPYVTCIFLASNLIRDVHEARDHEFIQLHKDMPHSTDEGLVAQWALRYYLPHPHLKCKVVRIPFVFNDHGVEYIHAFIIIPNSALSMLWAGPRTVANRDCRTPNALSTSFPTNSWRSAHNLSFALWGRGTVFTKVAHRG